MKQSKRGKIALWLAFLIFFSLLYFQNREFFEYKGKLVLDLFIFEFNTPPLPVVVYYAGFLLFGFCIAFIGYLIHKFRAKRTIQGLETKIQEKQEELEKLRNQSGSVQADDEKTEAEQAGENEDNSETAAAEK